MARKVISVYFKKSDLGSVNILANHYGLTFSEYVQRAVLSVFKYKRYQIEYELMVKLNMLHQGVFQYYGEVGYLHMVRHMEKIYDNIETNLESKPYIRKTIPPVLNISKRNMTDAEPMDMSVKKINISFTDEEHKQIKKHSRKKAITLSEFIEQSTLGFNNNDVSHYEYDIFFHLEFIDYFIQFVLRGGKYGDPMFYEARDLGKKRAKNKHYFF